MGRLDILVNDASATKHVANPADLDALSGKDFHRIFAVNTIAPFQMIRAARRLLEAAARATERASSVVNIFFGRCVQRIGFVDRLHGEQGGSQHDDLVARPRSRAANSPERDLPGLDGHAIVDERCWSRGGRQAARGSEGRSAVARCLNRGGHRRGCDIPRRPRFASPNRVDRTGRCRGSAAGSDRRDGRPALAMSESQFRTPSGPVRRLSNRNKSILDAPSAGLDHHQQSAARSGGLAFNLGMSYSSA